MIVVPDASIVVSSLFGQDGAEKASAILEGSDALLAPDLLPLEVGNAIWKLHRLRKISEDEAQIALEAFGGLPITYVPMTTLYRAATRLAMALDHSVYDCAYVALAEAKSATLVTADRRLLTRLAGSPLRALACDLDAFGPTH